jgi:hypothetical protein
LYHNVLEEIINEKGIAERKVGLIGEEKEEKYKRYHFDRDSRTVVVLMKSYYPSIWDRWSNRLAEMLLLMSKGEEDP